MEKHEKVSFWINVVLIIIFPTPSSQEDFEYLIYQFTSHLFLIQFNTNLVVIKLNWVKLKLKLKLVELEFNSNQIQFKLHCKVVCASISYKNELIFFISRTFEFFLLFHKDELSFPCFFNIYNFGANKDNLLHATHCIISSLPFSWNYLCQDYLDNTCSWHVNGMSMTYEHVLFN